MQAAKFYFLVRIIKDVQTERKEKIGRIYLAPNYVWMTRNMQCGEIVSIGERAAAAFPEAEVGHVLLFHHFIEEKGNSEFFVKEDDEYKYYAVPGVSIFITQKGEEKEKTPNRCFGIFDGERIITHKDYLFLKTAPPPEKVSVDDFFEKKTKTTESGIIIFKEPERETHQQKVEKLAKIKAKIDELCKIGVGNYATDAIYRRKEPILMEIQRLEGERDRIVASLNKKKYLTYTVAACNPELTNEAGFEVGEDSTVYMYNLGCQTEIEFNAQTYIVAQSKFLAGFSTSEVAEHTLNS
jgi:hypothetical protein